MLLKYGFILSHKAYWYARFGSGTNATIDVGLATMGMVEVVATGIDVSPPPVGEDGLLGTGIAVRTAVDGLLLGDDGGGRGGVAGLTLAAGANVGMVGELPLVGDTTGALGDWCGRAAGERVLGRGALGFVGFSFSFSSISSFTLPWRITIICFFSLLEIFIRRITFLVGSIPPTPFPVPPRTTAGARRSSQHTSIRRRGRRRLSMMTALFSYYGTKHKQRWAASGSAAVS
jgi:hypothetical protein